ncbi:hypothetical protein ARALYDRAFT_322360 [Arabidopsis lyrata subsp. lyrata]|uniref:Uncharacterized protein n=1 Tax=Arabidopsis lyrata subsp. lyrata TaxID=81972 RepID=D7LFZ2_ARALL|nr:hypothetical protein ARALYDRAFT_322360 [Arabidopsis lyrata subsp. lyrata]
MVLIVYWYDFICFATVAAAIVASLWFLLRRERGCLGIDDTGHVSLLPLYRSKSLGSAQLWTSCWTRLHPGWLLFTRSTSFLSMAALLAWDILKWDASIFVYYTEWTFMLVIIYFAMGIAASVYGCLIHSKELALETGEDVVVEKVGDEFRQRLEVYGCFMQTIFQTSAGAVVLTDIVFWLVIVPFLSNTRFGLNKLMICMHTANAGFLLLETVLNSLKFFCSDFSRSLGFEWDISCYGVVSILSWWPYPFLELDKPWAPIWYLSMAIVHIPCYGAYAAVVKAKNSCFPYLFPNAFVNP